MKRFDKRLKVIEEDLKPKIVNEEHKRFAIVQGFIPFAIKELGITSKPKFKFNKDKKLVLKLSSMAGFMPASNEVWVYIAKRNIADILRSTAHELVHCKQMEIKGADKIDGATGSEDENEANAKAGMLLRKYGKINPSIYE